MGKTLKILLAIFCVFAIAGFAGCTDECTDNQSSIGLAGFYNTAKKSISIDSISVYGVDVPNDSMILRNQTGVKQVYLPMPLNSESCKFVVHYDQKAISDIRYNDTLTLNYEAIPYFASAQCGAMYRFEIKEFIYTKHLIDSVAIPSMQITNADSETIQIYMRTTTNQ